MQRSFRSTTRKLEFLEGHSNLKLFVHLYVPPIIVELLAACRTAHAFKILSAINETEFVGHFDLNLVGLRRQLPKRSESVLLLVLCRNHSRILRN